MTELLFKTLLAQHLPDDKVRKGAGLVKGRGFTCFSLFLHCRKQNMEPRPLLSPEISLALN